MEDRSTLHRRGWLRLITTVLLAHAYPVAAQVPTRIPSDPEAQIFNLIQRVTALEQKVAALSNAARQQSGGTPSRVKAPFEVVDAAGRPLFQVVQFGPSMRMTTGGIVVTNEPTTGSSALLAFNRRRQTVAVLGSGPEGNGQLTLRDRRGHTRASLNGDGTLTIADPKGYSILHVAEDISAAEARVAIGGDGGDWIVDVGDSSGVTLGRTPQGGRLWVFDEKGTERVHLGEGVSVNDPAGNAFFSVAEEVSSDSAAVTIGGEDDGYRIAVDAGGTSAVMGAAGQIAGFATYKDQRPAGSFMLTEESNSLELTNDGGVNVVSLMVGQAGQGLLQLGNSTGLTVVDAGENENGVGLVRAHPVGHPGAGLVGLPGTYILGRR